MNVTEKIYAVLAVDTDVTALVPAARILPPGNWKNLTRPYVIHFPVSLTRHTAHRVNDDGAIDLQTWDFYQVSVYADTYSSADAVARAVQTALEGVHDGMHVFSRSGSRWFLADASVDEQQTAQVFHIALEFEIAEGLAADA